MSGAGVLCILAVNRGSSTLKFGLYDLAADGPALASGKVDRIGRADATLVLRDARSGAISTEPIADPPRGEPAEALVAALDRRVGFARVAAVGHRVVHGGDRYCRTERITPAMLDEIRRLSPYSPEHLPVGLAMIEACTAHLPGVPQIACFDTAFHHTIPAVARILPLPRRLYQRGVRRYGFHGLSYAYLMEELARIAGPQAAAGRIVLAHLGNGSSLAAVHRGQCVETTMGFTPAAGIPMATRSGDLDPGLVKFLAETEGMTAEQFHRMVNRESGLLGVSETSGDLRELLAREASDARAAEAIAVYCYGIKKAIGALCAVLGGLDTLVFSGGIGENAPEVRQRVCAGLEFLGIRLDEAANRAGAGVISTAGAPATVRVIATDEELWIARETRRVVRGEVQSP